MSLKIYCTNALGIPLARLEQEYGAKIVKLTEKYVDITKPLVIEQLETRVEGLLADSTEDDYVLLLGFHLVAVVVTKIWLRKHSKMKLLIHQRVLDRYISLEITR